MDKKLHYGYLSDWIDGFDSSFIALAKRLYQTRCVDTGVSPSSALEDRFVTTFLQHHSHIRSEDFKSPANAPQYPFTITPPPCDGTSPLKLATVDKLPLTTHLYDFIMTESTPRAKTILPSPPSLSSNKFADTTPQASSSAQYSIRTDRRSSAPAHKDITRPLSAHSSRATHESLTEFLSRAAVAVRARKVTERPPPSAAAAVHAAHLASRPRSARKRSRESVIPSSVESLGAGGLTEEADACCGHVASIAHSLAWESVLALPGEPTQGTTVGDLFSDSDGADAQLSGGVEGRVERHGTVPQGRPSSAEADQDITNAKASPPHVTAVRPSVASGIAATTATSAPASARLPLSAHRRLSLTGFLPPALDPAPTAAPTPSPTPSPTFMPLPPRVPSAPPRIDPSSPRHVRTHSMAASPLARAQAPRGEPTVVTSPRAVAPALHALGARARRQSLADALLLDAHMHTHTGAVRLENPDALPIAAPLHALSLHAPPPLSLSPSPHLARLSLLPSPSVAVAVATPSPRKETTAPADPPRSPAPLSPLAGWRRRSVVLPDDASTDSDEDVAHTFLAPPPSRPASPQPLPRGSPSALALSLPISPRGALRQGSMPALTLSPLARNASPRALPSASPTGRAVSRVRLLLAADSDDDSADDAEADEARLARAELRLLAQGAALARSAAAAALDTAAVLADTLQAHPSGIPPSSARTLAHTPSHTHMPTSPLVSPRCFSLAPTPRPSALTLSQSLSVLVSASVSVSGLLTPQASLRAPAATTGHHRTSSFAYHARAPPSPPSPAVAAPRAPPSLLCTISLSHPYYLTFRAAPRGHVLSLGHLPLGLASVAAVCDYLLADSLRFVGAHFDADLARGWVDAWGCYCGPTLPIASHPDTHDAAAALPAPLRHVQATPFPLAARGEGWRALIPDAPDATAGITASVTSGRQPMVGPSLRPVHGTVSAPVTHLDLSGADLSHPAAVAALCTLLRHTRTLTSLSVANCSLDTRGVCALTDALAARDVSLIYTYALPTRLHAPATKEPEEATVGSPTAKPTLARPAPPPWSFYEVPGLRMPPPDNTLQSVQVAAVRVSPLPSRHTREADLARFLSHDAPTATPPPTAPCDGPPAPPHASTPVRDPLCPILADLAAVQWQVRLDERAGAPAPLPSSPSLPAVPSGGDGCGSAAYASAGWVQLGTLMHNYLHSLDAPQLSPADTPALNGLAAPDSDGFRAWERQHHARELLSMAEVALERPLSLSEDAALLALPPHTTPAVRVQVRVAVCVCPPLLSLSLGTTDVRAAALPNRIGRHGAAALALLLRSNTHLRHLSLANTRLSSARVHALARGLRASAAPLRALALSGTTAGPVALATCISALAQTPLLAALVLDDSPVGDMGALALHRVLPALPHLRTLSLRRCRITRAGWLLLTHALPLCPLMYTLHVDGNALEDDRVGLATLSPTGASEAQTEELLVARARVLTAAELWQAYASALTLAGARKQGCRDAAQATLALRRWRESPADSVEGRDAGGGTGISPATSRRAPSRQRAVAVEKGQASATTWQERDISALVLSSPDANLSPVERAERALRTAVLTGDAFAAYLVDALTNRLGGATASLTPVADTALVAGRVTGTEGRMVSLHGALALAGTPMQALLRARVAELGLQRHSVSPRIALCRSLAVVTLSACDLTCAAVEALVTALAPPLVQRRGRIEPLFPVSVRVRPLLPAAALPAPYAHAAPRDPSDLFGLGTEPTAVGQDSTSALPHPRNLGAGAEDIAAPRGPHEYPCPPDRWSRMRCSTHAPMSLAHAPLVALDLSHNRVQERGARALARWLTCPCVHVHTLRLRGNPLGDEGAALLARGLAGLRVSMHHDHVRALSALAAVDPAAEVAAAVVQEPCDAVLLWQDASAEPCAEDAGLPRPGLTVAPVSAAAVLTQLQTTASPSLATPAAVNPIAPSTHLAATRAASVAPTMRECRDPWGHAWPTAAKRAVEAADTYAAREAALDRELGIVADAAPKTATAASSVGDAVLLVPCQASVGAARAYAPITHASATPLQPARAPASANKREAMGHKAASQPSCPTDDAVSSAEAQHLSVRDPRETATTIAGITDSQATSLPTLAPAAGPPTRPAQPLLSAPPAAHAQSSAVSFSAAEVPSSLPPSADTLFTCDPLGCYPAVAPALGLLDVADTRIGDRSALALAAAAGFAPHTRIILASNAFSRHWHERLHTIFARRARTRTQLAARTAWAQYWHQLMAVATLRKRVASQLSLRHALLAAQARCEAGQRGLAMAVEQPDIHTRPSCSPRAHTVSLPVADNTHADMASRAEAEWLLPVSASTDGRLVSGTFATASHSDSSRLATAIPLSLDPPPLLRDSPGDLPASLPARPSLPQLSVAATAHCMWCNAPRERAASIPTPLPPCGSCGAEDGALLDAFGAVLHAPRVAVVAHPAGSAAVAPIDAFARSPSPAVWEVFPCSSPPPGAAAENAGEAAPLASLVALRPSSLALLTTHLHRLQAHAVELRRRVALAEAHADTDMEAVYMYLEHTLQSLLQRERARAALLVQLCSVAREVTAPVTTLLQRMAPPPTPTHRRMFVPVARPAANFASPFARTGATADPDNDPVLLLRVQACLVESASPAAWELHHVAAALRSGDPFMVHAVSGVVCMADAAGLGASVVNSVRAAAALSAHYATSSRSLSSPPPRSPSLCSLQVLAGPTLSHRLSLYHAVARVHHSLRAAAPALLPFLAHSPPTYARAPPAHVPSSLTRPHTTFTDAWFHEVWQRCDAYLVEEHEVSTTLPGGTADPHEPTGLLAALVPTSFSPSVARDTALAEHALLQAHRERAEAALQLREACADVGATWQWLLAVDASGARPAWREEPVSPAGCGSAVTAGRASGFTASHAGVPNIAQRRAVPQHVRPASAVYRPRARSAAAPPPSVPPAPAAPIPSYMLPRSRPASAKAMATSSPVKASLPHRPYSAVTRAVPRRHHAATAAGAPQAPQARPQAMLRPQSAIAMSTRSVVRSSPAPAATPTATVTTDSPRAADTSASNAAVSRPRVRPATAPRKPSLPPFAMTGHVQSSLQRAATTHQPLTSVSPPTPFPSRATHLTPSLPSAPFAATLPWPSSAVLHVKQADARTTPACVQPTVRALLEDLARDPHVGARARRVLQRVDAPTASAPPSPQTLGEHVRGCTRGSAAAVDGNNGAGDSNDAVPAREVPTATEGCGSEEASAGEDELDAPVWLSTRSTNFSAMGAPPLWRLALDSSESTSGGGTHSPSRLSSVVPMPTGTGGVRDLGDADMVQTNTRIGAALVTAPQVQAPRSVVFDTAAEYARHARRAAQWALSAAEDGEEMMYRHIIINKDDMGTVQLVTLRHEDHDEE